MASFNRSIYDALRSRIAAFNPDFQDALKAELEVPAKRLTTKHRRVVSSWTNKPIFAYRISVNGKQVRLTVYPRGEGRQLYLWIDRGTKPYVIRPKKGKYLRFQAGYDAKTSAATSSFTKGSGGRFGSFVTVKEINHPGIAARNFSEKFAKETLPEMQRIIENAFRRAVRQSL